jgi:hypothetical protein
MPPRVTGQQPRRAQQPQQHAGGAGSRRLAKLIIFGSALTVLLATTGSLEHLQILFRSTLSAQQAPTSTQAALSEQKMAPPTVAVVGTGLAGLSAAYELSQALQAELPEARVVVFEKNKFLGGNSMKASSGINAVNPAAEDTEAIYAEDTRKSGGGLSKEDLVAQLVVGCNCCCCSSTTAAVPGTAIASNEPAFEISSCIDMHISVLSKGILGMLLRSCAWSSWTTLRRSLLFINSNPCRTAAKTESRSWRV